MSVRVPRGGRLALPKDQTDGRTFVEADGTVLEIVPIPTPLWPNELTGAVTCSRERGRLHLSRNGNGHT